VAQKAKVPGARGLRRYAAAGPDKQERDDFLLAFGQRLKAFRLAAGFTQERLAACCFIGRDHVWGLESGKRAPELPELLVLADRLGVPAGELIEGLQAPVRRAGTAQVLDQIMRQARDCRGGARNLVGTALLLRVRDRCLPPGHRLDHLASEGMASRHGEDTQDVGLMTRGHWPSRAFEVSFGSQRGDDRQRAELARRRLLREKAAQIRACGPSRSPDEAQGI